MAGITVPGARPAVALQGRTSEFLVGTTPSPLSVNVTQYDTVVLNVISTRANSVFMGFGSNVTVNNGVEIQPGIPTTMGWINTREQWELQRQLEFMSHVIGQLMNHELQVPQMPYKAPIVTIDLSQIWVVAPANTIMAVLAFLPAEYQ